jgi:radical SAM superfamily enzyme YgiQ (UPF0313 family)
MRVLLVRPWIHDFSAYDLWIQPLGLLYLGGVLADNGFDLHYVDCLENRYEVKEDGRAKFAKTIIASPEPLKGVKRRYGRFGITPEDLNRQINGLQKPDAILITSGMTYWYPGVQETIRHLRAAFPAVSIFLGGIYATLMPGHAGVHSGADQVFTGEFENQILALLTNGRRQSSFRNLNDYPRPAWHLTGQNSYRVLMTSRGCPYRCTFCASDILNEQKFQQRAINDLVAEIETYYFEDHIEHFVFYDDALLINHKRHLQPLLESILSRGIRAKFHTPNGLNAREIDSPLASLMRAAGFVTIRLSLESVNPDIQKIQGNNKVNNHLFERAVKNLYRAGYREGELECYLIQGLPDQTMSDVRNSLAFVADLGVIARLATYSPIPGTREAELARNRIGDGFFNEPLLQNHSFFPLKNTAMTQEDLQTIKNECNANNARLRKFDTVRAEA